MSHMQSARELRSYMEETNGGGSPESVEGFNFFRAVTAGFRHGTPFTPTVLRDRPDGGFFSESGAAAPESEAKPEKVLGFDNRQRITDTSLTPWRCICHLEVQYDRGPVGFGTGFLAGETLLLTAAHVLVDRSLYGWHEKPRIAERVRVAPGRDAAMAPYGAFVTDIPTRGKTHLIPEEWKTVIRKGTDPSAAQKAAEAADCAGIRLDLDVAHQQIGQRLGYFGLKDLCEFPEENREFLFVNTAGYPHGPRKPYGTLWYNAGRTSGIDASRRFIDYMVDTEGGQSGSPIYYYDKQANQRFVIAIHTTGDFVNRGLLTAGDIYDRIEAWRGHP